MLLALEQTEKPIVVLSESLDIYTKLQQSKLFNIQFIAYSVAVMKG